MGEIKMGYQVSGLEFYNLCEGIENYEVTVAKEKNQAAKIIQETVDQTIGASFKDMREKTDKFASAIVKKVARLHLEEKD